MLEFLFEVLKVILITIVGIAVSFGFLVAFTHLGEKLLDWLGYLLVDLPSKIKDKLRKKK